MATSSNYAPNLCLSVRSSEKTSLYYKNEVSFDDYHTFVEEQPDARAMKFSVNGEFFAYCNNSGVHIMHVPSKTITCCIERRKISLLKFSPTGNLICLWDSYSVKSGEKIGDDNLTVHDSKSGEQLASFRRKERSCWGFQWSIDEKLCARLNNHEVHFYEDNDFSKVARRIQIGNIEKFYLSTKSPSPSSVGIFVPGQKGQPSSVRLFKYPNFAASNMLANRSFFKADKVEMIWNSKGTAMLLLTATDTSADSYYGESGLHFISTNGESCIVERSKNGPVYHVEWAPSNKEFCVVYGFMPAKVTIYNLKCDAVFDFGTGPRNCAYYNCFGNILALGGFGNLKGDVEFWDVQKKKKISTLNFPDTTSFKWAPDGMHIVTATCAPRLRVGNGFKIWTYNGQLIYEQPLKELWEVTWQPVMDGLFKPTVINHNTIIKEKASDISNGQTEKQNLAYVPPALRGRQQPNIKIRDDYEPPSDLRNKGGEESSSKMAIKNRKKREAKKLKNDTQKSNMTNDEITESTTVSSNPEKEKKIMNLNKKLRAIEKLKLQQNEGKQLEINQIEKIKTEPEILKELLSLSI